MSYKIRNKEDYTNSYKNSVENTTQFWEDIAQKFTWFKPWDRIMECDMK
jgi:acetyl-CoA synthetase